MGGRRIFSRGSFHFGEEGGGIWERCEDRILSRWKGWDRRGNRALRNSLIIPSLSVPAWVEDEKAKARIYLASVYHSNHIRTYTHTYPSA